MAERKQALKALGHAGNYLDDAYHAVQEAHASLEAQEQAKLAVLRQNIRSVRHDLYDVGRELREENSEQAL